MKRANGDDHGGQNKKHSGHWSSGLLATMKDPESIVQQDDLVVVIKDKYPKAQFHFLILPKENISTLSNLNSTHLNLLEHMDQVGQQLANSYPTHNFRLGYHAVPSMTRLHLHVISDDFVSPSLKTKKHWNSFVTEFFLPSQNVIAEIEKTGKIQPMPRNKVQELMNTPLKCHKCTFVPANIPKLKDHILTHLKKVAK